MSAPKSPGTTRTSRDRALEIGTSPSGFPADLPYDAQAGAPPDRAPGHYQTNVPTPGTHPSPAPSDPSPFKLGGK